MMTRSDLVSPGHTVLSPDSQAALDHAVRWEITFHTVVKMRLSSKICGSNLRNKGKGLKNY